MRTIYDYILWAVAFVFLIIGIDQSVKGLQSYWAFMISLMALFLLNWFKITNKEKEKKEANTHFIANEKNLKEKKVKKEKSKDYTPARKRK